MNTLPLNWMLEAQKAYIESCSQIRKIPKLPWGGGLANHLHPVKTELTALLHTRVVLINSVGTIIDNSDGLLTFKKWTAGL